MGRGMTKRPARKTAPHAAAATGQLRTTERTIRLRNTGPPGRGHARPSGLSDETGARLKGEGEEGREGFPDGGTPRSGGTAKPIFSAVPGAIGRYNRVVLAAGEVVPK